ncbi:MAG: ABC transporter ATP-binding protein [Spirochaetales bacterium]|nr:ABC transporter ATP-binding protein [Spirochaetales bacterium]
MEDKNTILEVKNLKTFFHTEEGVVKAVNDVSFSIHDGETLGIVGESGCGKSVTSFSIMGLVPMPPGKIEGGEILYKGKDLLKIGNRGMQKIRGNEISMIFQEPMTALNPVMTVGRQITEVLELHTKLSAEEQWKKAVDMIRKVGISEPEKRANSYPHELSGGMRQRIMIAMALACEPSLLIADEPTTALDVTIQAQILELMKEMQKEYNSALLLITHDLAVVAETVDRVIVMYAGEVVENADVETLFKDAKHPYTQGLLKSIPVLGNSDKELKAIEGRVPSLIDLPTGCPFNNRCSQVFDRCKSEDPELLDLGNNHTVRCHLYSQES